MLKYSWVVSRREFGARFTELGAFLKNSRATCSHFDQHVIDCSLMLQSICKWVLERVFGALTPSHRVFGALGILRMKSYLHLFSQNVYKKQPLMTREFLVWFFFGEIDLDKQKEHISGCRLPSDKGVMKRCCRDAFSLPFVFFHGILRGIYPPKNTAFSREWGLFFFNGLSTTHNFWILPPSLT